MSGFLKNEIALFGLAVQFLTRLPWYWELRYSQDRLNEAARYFPAVGVLVGAIGAAILELSLWVLPVGVSILIATAATILVTGAFHEDGLADTFDGIGGGTTRERALEIMKDSRLGTYGTLALGITVSVKIASLFAMDMALVAVAMICAHGLSRLSAVLVMATSVYVRAAGTAKPMATGLSPAASTIAFATGGGCCLMGMIWLGIVPVIGGLAGLMIGHVVMRKFFEPKLGGYTGDCLGAVQQLSEIGFLLGVLACL